MDCDVNRSGCSARRHGDENAYRNYRCRCDDARDAARIAAKRRREGRARPGRIPVTIGLVRRAQGLHAAGHTTARIVTAGGFRSKDAFEAIRNRETATVTGRTVRCLMAAVTVLGGEPGASSRTAADAARKGWARLDEWCDIDDPHEDPRGERTAEGTREPDELAPVVLVERSGAWRSMARVDRDHALVTLVEAGWPVHVLAVRVGESPDVVRSGVVEAFKRAGRDRPQRRDGEESWNAWRVRQYARPSGWRVVGSCV